MDFTPFPSDHLNTHAFEATVSHLLHSLAASEVRRGNSKRRWGLPVCHVRWRTNGNVVSNDIVPELRRCGGLQALACALKGTSATSLSPCLRLCLALQPMKAGKDSAVEKRKERQRQRVLCVLHSQNPIASLPTAFFLHDACDAALLAWVKPLQKWKTHCSKSVP